MEKETKRGNGIQEAKSSILFISTRISAACVKQAAFFIYRDNFTVNQGIRL